MREDIERISAVAQELSYDNILMADANTGCTSVSHSLRPLSPVYTRLVFRFSQHCHHLVSALALCCPCLDPPFSHAHADAGLMHEAVRVVEAVRHVDVFIEQPCASYEENVSVRRQCTRPFILDENIEDIAVILKVTQRTSVDILDMYI